MKTIAFDLDDVICWHHPDYDEVGVDKYYHCEPIESGVELVNEYYDKGYRIIIYTARGMGAYKGNVNLVYERLYDLTFNHLNEWGVKFHRLVMGKLSYDLLIDDKAISSFLATRERIEEYFQE
jgi:hypothetical protein